MDTTVADSLIGTLIDGRYRTRARVARGGMATVYSALDERLERVVALKIIHPTQAQDPHFLDRFNGEAKVIARLTHPNVVAVYDQGTHSGLPYLVMEYVRGETLREVLIDRRRLAPLEALAILEQMLSAIAAAHRAGLVHRDVKPENVLVAAAPIAGANSLVDAVVKVADFGLARAVEASADDAGGSQLLATAAYVAPELVTDGHADPRTDVYSAGVVLFEMLTGRVPYEGERPVDVAWQHVDHDLPAPSRYVPGLPPILDELVARATRRDPSGRPTDAGAMLAEVQAAREEIGVAMSARASAEAQPTMEVPQVPPGQAYASGAQPRTPGAQSYPTTALPYASGALPSGTGQPGARPQWARLPDERPEPRPGGARRRGGSSALDRYREVKDRVLASPRGRLAIAATIITLGMMAAIGGYWFGIARYTTAPSLVNTAKPAAELMAKRSGFKIRYDDGQYSEKVPKDTVLAQHPGGGERILNGGTIVLTLSRGPERYPMPDLVGKPYDLALEDAQKIRLVVQKAEAYSDAVLAGSIAETIPAAGTPVAPGTTITLKVSKGRAPITMPNVVGMNVNEARDQLQRLGLQVAVKQADSDKPKDSVMVQDPVDGTGLEKGATVTLTISNGPAQVEVPDVTGMNVDTAQAELAKVGLKARVVGVGNTVRIQNPGAHEKVPGGTEITLWVFA